MSCTKRARVPGEVLPLKAVSYPQSAESPPKAPDAAAATPTHAASILQPPGSKGIRTCTNQPRGRNRRAANVVGEVKDCLAVGIITAPASARTCWVATTTAIEPPRTPPTRSHHLPSMASVGCANGAVQADGRAAQCMGLRYGAVFSTELKPLLVEHRQHARRLSRVIDRFGHPPELLWG